MFLLELSAWIASSVSCSLALMKNPSVLRFIGCLLFPPLLSQPPCSPLGAPGSVPWRVAGSPSPLALRKPGEHGPLLVAPWGSDILQISGTVAAVGGHHITPVCLCQEGSATGLAEWVGVLHCGGMDSCMRETSVALNTNGERAACFEGRCVVRIHGRSIQLPSASSAAELISEALDLLLKRQT